MKNILSITRWLYSAFFLLIGAHALLVVPGILPRMEYPGNPEIDTFTEAIYSTGFISPIMSVTYAVSGTLMFFNRTAPLGLVLLAPFVVVIFFTNLMLNGNIIMGTIIALLWGIFVWQFRRAYQPMWNYQVESWSD